MSQVIEDLWRIKQQVLGLKGVDNNDPATYVNLALTRDEIKAWIEQCKEQIRLLEEILEAITEVIER